MGRRAARRGISPYRQKDTVKADLYSGLTVIRLFDKNDLSFKIQPLFY